MDKTLNTFDLFENGTMVKDYYSGKMVKVESGQIGSGDTAEEEFRSAWQLVGEILAEAGLDYSDIIEFTSYHVGLQEHLGDFMKVKDEFIKEPYPAWTAIGVSELAVPGARVEIRVRAG